MAEPENRESPENAENPESTENPEIDGIPGDVSADYANEAAQRAMHELQADPDYERLATLLNALREGYLIADVTGTSAKRQGQRGKGPRVRTIRSTQGQLVLPLFTSMDRLRAAGGAANPDDARGLIMPAREALALIASDRFVAAEFDKGSPDSLVVLRKYVSLAVADKPITAELLEGGR